MFRFDAHIIKRRRVKKSALFFGLIAAGLLGYFGLTYLEYGYIPFLEKLIRQIGISGWTSLIYLSVFAVLLLLVLPAIHTIFKKKVVVGGQVSFDEKELLIVKGKDRYLIPEDQLKDLRFELKALPDPSKKKQGKLFGGSWMKIPTKKGTFMCELDIDSPDKRSQLLNMVEYLKIEHDVNVKVEDI